MAMVTPGYVLAMARYNNWQNRQMQAAFAGLGKAELERDRGAHFGSILGTLNHLLWGDALWMARFEGGQPPAGGFAESTAMTPSFGEWAIARFRMDARILAWAEALRAVDLAGNLNWYGTLLGRHMSKPMSLCVTHMFNHQTHHRGQLHAMATMAGCDGWTSDLIFMPEEGAS